MGTRAVDRVDNDYPRMIALSHPQLRPETSAQAIRQYSQWYIDVIDLEENKFKTLHIQDILNESYPELRYIASLDKGDYLQEIFSLGSRDPRDQFVLTFNYLTKDRKFVKLMRTALQRLEAAYGTPVDMEFTVEVIPNYPYPDYRLNLLQCRPLSQRRDQVKVSIPTDIPTEDILFRTKDLIPDGKAEAIRYIIFVDPIRYREIGNPTIKLELGRAISRLNKLLENEDFILMGPGRWGSANLELGVKVTYADIYNTKVLIEMAVPQDGNVPELSYGTHFFQDLVESGIYSLPIHLVEDKADFNWPFFTESPNVLATLLPNDAFLGDYLRVIDVCAVTANRRLTILMDGTKDDAVGYLVSGDWAVPEIGQETISVF
jgi:hypothetical protein